MNLSVVKESEPGEERVALVPAHIPSLVKLGVEVSVERGAGFSAGFTDDEYEDKGAKLTTRADALAKADVLVAVRSGAAIGNAATDIEVLAEGATIIAQLNPYTPDPSFKVMSARQINAVSLERIPRITRAQSMDVLSSQANLAGYQAVLIGAERLNKMLPMMMTAAGTIVPARVFVVGVGVAGLQAIATAKRLGAVVSAYDIRPAVKEQVESLGAKFVELDLSTGDSETSGGYAREMDEEFYRKQREMMTSVLAQSDVVITTAAIPGKKAPTLVTREMVEAMPTGSIVVDLAAERGGNCELTQPGEEVTHNGVLILGPLNVASRIAHHASQLFSKNVVTLLESIVTEGSIALNGDDEIIAATLVLDKGAPTDSDIAGMLGLEYQAPKES